MKQWDSSKFAAEADKKNERVCLLETGPEVIAARKKCLHLLEYAPRSEHMLEQKLLESGFSAILAKDAILYAKQFGYVDDVQFAEGYVAYRCTKKSRRCLMQELCAKGVSREIANQVIEDCTDENEAAVYTAQKRIRRRPLETEEDVKKLVQYLIGKGFSYSISNRISEQLWNETAES